MSLARVTEEPRVLVIPGSGTVALDTGCEDTEVVSFRTEGHFDAWLDELAKQRGFRLAPVDDGLVLARDLGVGCYVKVGDEWFTFDGTDGHGRMVLWPREGNAGPTFYPPSPGEKFAVEEPFE